MGVEIERKFLVKTKAYRQFTEGILYKQGYLCSHPDRVVRVRLKGSEGFITIKGKPQGISRAEYEYPIPVEDANEMLKNLCEKPVIEKYRYTFALDGFTWEIDEFHGDNEGLVIAEIELEKEDARFTRPDWIGEEVTGDKRYYNSNLVKNPYKNWCKK